MWPKRNDWAYRGEAFDGVPQERLGDPLLLRMRYDRARRTFEYPESDFFAGGPVRAYEIYDGLFY